MVATAEARQVCRAAGSLLYPSLDFGAKVNGTYPSEDFGEVLTRSAFERKFTNTSARHLQLARGDDLDLEDRSPLAKSLLYNLETMDADAIGEQFDVVRNQFIAQTHRARRFPNTAEVALDLHEWLYYGSKQTPMVSRINPDRGTNLAYVFVTLCVVSPSARFTLASEHVDRTDTPSLIEAIREVIETAQQAVSITRIYCDRGLYRVELVDELVNLGVEFVMRAPKTPGIKRVLAEHNEERFVTDYELVRKRSPTMRVPVTLVVVPHQSRDDDSLCLITNRARTVDEAVPLAQAYRRRWGIETFYRKVGEFLSRTTSPVFAVRLFYFLFAVALYNLWVVVCLLLSEQCRVKTRPAVSTATFRFFLGPVTYG
ncbi:transposase [Haloarcula sp. JP-L23]|uniref:transposase n=1 Tax=Haloarcula sp. JP-L23 TaxID=2716717 RepID=UPI00140EFB2C|nr:transposase [Haloarcula sp. JP-L23]